MHAKFIFPLLLLIGFAFVCAAAVTEYPGTSLGITRGEAPEARGCDGLGPSGEREVDHVDTLWWTGNIEQHIFAGQTLSWQPDLPQMTGVLMQIKYGLWNSPNVDMDVRVNSQLVGTLVASLGYISPGPKYALANISNYIVAGPDLIEIIAQPGGGEAVIGFVAVGVRTGAELDGIDPTLVITEDYAFLGASPNPFNPTTTIRFQLPESDHVLLRIYDTSGKWVADLINGWREAGSQLVSWDASGLPSGIYLAELRAGNSRIIRKLVLIK